MTAKTLLSNNAVISHFHEILHAPCELVLALQSLTKVPGGGWMDGGRMDGRKSGDKAWSLKKKVAAWLFLAGVMGWDMLAWWLASNRLTG